MIAALAVATPIGALQAENAPLGIHVRVKGLHDGVVLSGGRTDAERAWIVPLRGRDSLKVEVPPVLAGDVVFHVELASDDGVVARRTVELRVKTAGDAAPNPEADSARRTNEAAGKPPAAGSPGTASKPGSSAAGTPSVSAGDAPPDLASVGPHFRIKGLPADVTLSGGSTDAERAWPIPLSNGKQAWMVPLWVLDHLKIEFPSSVVGNLDLVIALDNVGGAQVERAIALRAKPVIVATPRRAEPDAEQRTAVAAPPAGSAAPAAPSAPEPDVGQRSDAVIATPLPPPGSAVPAVPSGSEPGADQHSAAVITTPALPPSSATLAAPSAPEPDADQRSAAAVATPATPPTSATPAAPSESEPGADQRRDVAIATPTPAMSERKSAAEPQAPTKELEQAARLVRQGDQYLAQGNIAVARQYFVRAANLGLAMAALKMAETYDPNELARLNVYGVKPNADEARNWYQRASDLGSPEAKARVQRQGTR